MEEAMADAVAADLTVPISEGNPCGEDMSFSPEFDRIHEARREDDPSLDYGEWASALKQADWKAVVNECEALLKHKTKDMRVAAWLTEGLIKTSGLAGLRRGLDVHVSLLRDFGMGLHPRSEDGDDDRRIGTVAWFIQRSAFLGRRVPLTESASGRFSLMDYESAVSLQLRLQRHPDPVPALDDQVTLEHISKAVSTTNQQFFAAQLDLINHCATQVEILSTEIGKMIGGNAPSFSPLAECIEAIRTRLLAICRDQGLTSAGIAKAIGLQQEEPSSPVSLNGAAGNADAVSNAPVARFQPNGIASRTDALEALRQVAAYFRSAEPHSPVAYMAEKALHWSEMPLHQWLRSVVKDAGVLAHLEDMLGAEASMASSGERGDV